MYVIIMTSQPKRLKPRRAFWPSPHTSADVHRMFALAPLVSHTHIHTHTRTACFFPYRFHCVGIAAATAAGGRRRRSDTGSGGRRGGHEEPRKLSSSAAGLLLPPSSPLREDRSHVRRRQATYSRQNRERVNTSTKITTEFWVGEGGNVWVCVAVLTGPARKKRTVNYESTFTHTCRTVGISSGTPQQRGLARHRSPSLYVRGKVYLLGPAVEVYCTLPYSRIGFSTEYSHRCCASCVFYFPRFLQ